MITQRLCLTARDHRGNPIDDESWLVVDTHTDAWPRLVDAFVAYLTGRGIAVGELHVGTEDWLRDQWPQPGTEI